MIVFTDMNCKLERNDNGSYIVRISATSTIVVAELRRPLVLLFMGETGAYIHLDKHSLHVRIFGSSENVDRDEQRFIDSLLELHNNKQLEVHHCRGYMPPNLMKRVITTFGPDLSLLKEKVLGVEFPLNTKCYCIFINGTKDMKQSGEDTISEIAQSSFPTQTKRDEAHCVVCLCELEDPYRLKAYTHVVCRLCLLDQCKSAIKSREGFPI
ncbi:hypothetical protein CQW23_23278 [Capsicum baccatum]|uniref:Uncharacterized protein n=1 Tax=Capsicum baccatum TaxID=33114 RepID=A0A2G2VRI3_CAPBA|nr:hypothetical protein CQW23_23278 [Capsicum baccatum]